MVTIILLFSSAVLLDQITKIMVKNSMVLGQSVSVIGDYVRFTFVENPGIAFGIRLGNGNVLTALSVLASLGILGYLLTHRDEAMGVKAGLALILGGACGNLIDRLLYGKVVDFIEMGIDKYRWPVYNIADAAVVIGMAVLLYTVYRTEQSATQKTAEEV